MQRYSFILGILGLAFSFAHTAHADPTGDLVLLNGKVYTLREREPIVEAVAIHDGKIVYVGASQQALQSMQAGVRVIDLEGKTVVPGFIDAHGHLMGLGQSLRQLNLVGTPTYRSIIDLVEARAEDTPRGTWIQGRSWDQNDWPVKDFPQHARLSARSQNNPVALTRIDGHALLANAWAMRLAGITPDTPNPPGGRIVRDASGAATGVFIDRAMGLVTRHIPPPDDRQRRQAIESAIRACVKLGLTTIHDAGVSGKDIDLYRRLIDDGAFDFRVYAMISVGDSAALGQYFDSGPLVGYGADQLTVRSVKAVIDGALGSRGAAMIAPYSDDSDNTGLLLMEETDLTELTTRALRAGFQVATHAIGDRGNRVVLDAYEDALKSVPRKVYGYNPRLRIEHAQIVKSKDIRRFAELDVIASIQATHATSDMYWAEDRVGPKRIAGAYAWRRFLRNGVRIANGSDFPVENANPLWGFYASITRQDHQLEPEGGWYPEQRLTREEALRSFTVDGAYAAFEEELKGTLDAGMLGDLVVLSQDIMEIDPADILETEVLLTVIGGTIVYQK